VAQPGPVLAVLRELMETAATPVWPETAASVVLASRA
jgi:hypothetical protein